MDRLPCAQHRPLVALRVDRVLGTAGPVEIRAVLPTGPNEETTPVGHGRLDYLGVHQIPVFGIHEHHCRLCRLGGTLSDGRHEDFCSGRGV